MPGHVLPLRKGGGSGPHVIYASLGPPESITQNGILISSAVFAQLTAECCYTLQRAAPFPLIITPSHGGSGPHLTHDSLGPSEPTTRRASQFGSDVFAQMTGEWPYTLQWDATSPTKLPFPMDVWDVDPNLIHSSLGPPESSTQTASQSLQPFLQGSLVWQTDRPHYSVSNNRPPFVYVVQAMWPNNNKNNNNNNNEQHICTVKNKSPQL